MKLFISKSKELGVYELSVLTALNGLYSNKNDCLPTSIDLIAYMLTGKFLCKTIKKDRVMAGNIRHGIKSLSDRNLITILGQSGDNYCISNTGLEVNTENENFVVVDLWEMQKIFAESNKPFNVFAFFVNLVGTINHKTKEWHMPQDDMASTWKVSKRTINDYMEQLENMHLIYVYRQKKRRSDGTYHKINNSYGRYCDKDDIIASAQGYADTIECEDLLEKLDRRTIKLRYNAYRDNSEKYKGGQGNLIDLYRDCKDYNKSLEFKPVEGTYDGEWKQGRLLDLSIFPYDIIQGDLQAEEAVRLTVIETV